MRMTKLSSGACNVQVRLRLRVHVSGGRALRVEGAAAPENSSSKSSYLF